MPRLHIGISGWTYPPWRGDFYPTGLTHARELEYASQQVSSIEINGTFYALQRPSSFVSWRQRTPEGFVFAVKGGRFITHMKKLRDVETPLANFFACGVLALGDKLGPVLWQLPPNFGLDLGRLAGFLELLPRTTYAAAALAARHDERMTDRAWMTTDADRPVRHALEVRHASYVDPAFVALLRDHNVALVTADTAGKWPFLEDRTADFSYARLHGDKELYVSGYSPQALDAWAEKVRAWSVDADPPDARTVGAPLPSGSGERDVFVYFDNDVKVRAPYDAMALAARLGVGPEDGVGSGDGEDRHA
jgi:uncharacterized protein YecE (DUF72 family)